MVDIHWEGHNHRSASQKTQIAYLRRCSLCTPRKLSDWDRGSDKMQPPMAGPWLGGVGTAFKNHLVTWAARTWEGHKTQAQPSLSLCGLPENLNLSGLDLESACNPRPATDSSPQSNLEPEQCRLGKHTCHEQGQTQCGRDTASTPHTC